jgi:hypothetical protein
LRLSSVKKNPKAIADAATPQPDAADDNQSLAPRIAA